MKKLLIGGKSRNGDGTLLLIFPGFLSLQSKNFNSKEVHLQSCEHSISAVDCPGFG